jgi:predicted DNA-binding protein with PD1-like motif
MISAEITTGRRFAVVLQPGDDVLASIAAICAEHRIEQGYLPVFLGAFTRVSLIGTCSVIDDHDAPLPDSVHLEGVEGTGSGTIAFDPATGAVTPHVHVAVGVKAYSANGYAGHLLQATVHYVTELVIEEVLSPRFIRKPDAAAHGLANLSFDRA